MVKETENQYCLMAKILMFRGVKQEHGYELEASSTGGRGETSEQKVDLSKCCQPLTRKSSSPGDIHHAVYTLHFTDERGREEVLVGVKVLL